MKKIIITGGLGYIGMELCKIFSGKSRQLDITVIDNNFASSRVSQLKRWGIKFKQIDILDSKNLEKEIHNADVIYHLAGITDVATTKDDVNIEKEKKVYDVGVVGTQNIIKFFPSESKQKVHSSTVDQNSRIYASTLQTMKNNYRDFPIGFFDVIISELPYRKNFRTHCFCFFISFFYVDCSYKCLKKISIHIF